MTAVSFPSSKLSTWLQTLRGRWDLLAVVTSRLRTVVTAAAVAGLVIAVAWAGVFIHQFTQTPFPIVEQTFQQAAQASRPIRYNNVWFSLYYAQVYGVEVLTGDDRWIEADQAGQAVLMFKDASPPELSRENYTIQSTTVSPDADKFYPVLTREARLPRQLDVWWPTGPSQSIQPQGEPHPVATYFPGTGCVTPKAYGNGTLHYYQLAWRKLFGLET